MTLLEKCLATYSTNSTSIDESSPNKTSKSGDISSKREDVSSKNKSKKRISLESQFYGHRPFMDVVNPLKPSEKCHRLQVNIKNG